MVNNNVVFFFAVGAVAFAFLAIRYVPSPERTFKLFGAALGLLSLAFAIWGVIVGVHPADAALELWTTIGVFPFGLASLAFVAAATSDWSKKTQNVLLGVAAVVLGVLFVVRTFIDPSSPSFSDSGLFYFNAKPLALLLYVVVFAGAIMPAIHVVTSHLASKSLATATRLSFNLVTLSSVVLLVSKDDELQNWNGYLLLAGLLALVIAYVSNKPAYKNS